MRLLYILFVCRPIRGNDIHVFQSAAFSTVPPWELSHPRPRPEAAQRSPGPPGDAHHVRAWHGVPAPAHNYQRRATIFCHCPLNCGAPVYIRILEQKGGTYLRHKNIILFIWTSISILIINSKVGVTSKCIGNVWQNIKYSYIIQYLNHIFINAVRVWGDFFLRRQQFLALKSLSYCQVSLIVVYNYTT